MPETSSEDNDTVLLLVISQVNLIDSIDYNQVADDVRCPDYRAARKRWLRVKEKLEKFKQRGINETQIIPTTNELAIITSVFKQEIAANSIDFERLARDLGAPNADVAKERWACSLDRLKQLGAGGHLPTLMKPSGVIKGRSLLKQSLSKKTLDAIQREIEEETYQKEGARDEVSKKDVAAQLQERIDEHNQRVMKHPPARPDRAAEHPSKGVQGQMNQELMGPGEVVAYPWESPWELVPESFRVAEGDMEYFEKAWEEVGASST